jgi:hypothetical protein
MKHEIFAPVFIPTLCRYKHFKRCVESLAKCTYAENTDLIIALDYPLKDSHWDGYKKIKEYIKHIHGFKSVKIIKRDENFGAFKNVHSAREWIYERYDMLIGSEDDNEFSPNFLDYMNACLSKYINHEDVIAITGYNRMIDMSTYNHNVYTAISFSAWGVGNSKSNELFLHKKVKNKEYALSILKSWKKTYKIYKIAPQLLRGLLSIVKTGHVTGDTLVVSYMILNQKYCIWPTVSKVRNHGFDGGGEHFGSNLNHPMLTQAIDKDTSFEPDDIEIKSNDLISLRTKQYATKQMSLLWRLIFKTYIPIRYLIYRITGIIIYK